MNGRSDWRLRRSAGLVFGLTLLLPALACAKDPAETGSPRRVPTSWHATSYVRGDIGLRVIDYWSRGANMRARTTVVGHPIVTLVRGDRYVVYDELTRQGLEVGRSPAALAADAVRLRPFAFELEELIREGGEKIEETTLGRLQAEVWQLTDAAGRRKLWVTADQPRVPIRVQRFDRASGATIETDYSGWIFDLEMVDAFFAPPPDVVLERYEYDAFVQWALEGGSAPVPILYPDLLHGGPSD